MAERGRAISALQGALFADIAEFDQAESWRGDGAVSMAAWLTQRCGVGRSTAAAWVRAAVKLESLPHLAGALAEGALSLDAVAPLAEVATPQTDAELAKASVHWSVKQIRELAASHRGTVDAAAARRFQHRTLRFDDIRTTVWVAFTKDDYAVAKGALMARMSWGSNTASGGHGAATASGGGDPSEYVPFDQRLYDAFMNLCREDGASRSGGGGGSTGFRPTVVVHAELGMLTGLNPEGVAELAGVGRVSREVARRLACDANIVFSLERSDGCILDQKRARRSPTTFQRMEIARRDKGCRFAGCGFTDFTEVHHVVPWTLGGETNLSNLITLCGRHHRAVHELGWSMSGDADGVVTFKGPHGHRMTSAPSPTWRSPRTTPMRR
ncbi:MAG: DUF222 domain-containing protein [Acidimicrobiales bacterium]